MESIDLYINENCRVLREIDRDPVYFRVINKFINKGNLAQIVYNIKYIPACRRSGWYPQPNTKRRVGIREASNIR